MRNSLYAALLVLAAASIFVLAQSSNAPSSQTPSATQDQDRNAAQPPASQTSGGAQNQNEILQRQVQQQLATDSALSNVRAEVSGKKVVTLTGAVAAKKDRDHAKQLAASVPGVRKVKDKIKIGGAAASAAATSQGGSAGASASASQPAGINTAGSIAGNTEAHAGSSGSAASSGTNNTVQAQIQQALQNEPTLSSSVVQNIAVNVVNNHIILSGTVPSERDKDKAQEVAQQQAGGMQVVNNIQVSSSAASSTPGTGTTGGAAGAAGSTAPSSSTQGASDTSGNVGAATQPSAGVAGQSAATEQGTPVTGPSSAQNATDLKSQIKNSLQKEQLTGVIVNVTDNSVELSGTVRNGKEKQTARRIAQSFAGNHRMVDHITITGEGRGANASPGS